MIKGFGLIAAIAVACLIFVSRAIAQTDASPDQLIDDLTSLDCPIPGVSDTGTFEGFIAEEKSSEPAVTRLIPQDGQLRVPATCRNAVVENIMRAGPAALPSLIRHIDDKRPTKLIIGQDFSRQPMTVGGQYFAAEYQSRQLHRPRHLDQRQRDCKGDIDCIDNWRPFDLPYTVKVGDVCFVLVGQIVNRHLNAVRYQPTMIVLVNSPIETPSLADRVRADWGGVDREGLRNALLTDLRMAKLKDAPDARTESAVLEWLHSGALRRLRYYFPDTYAALTGADLEKREAFEKAELAR